MRLKHFFAISALVLARSLGVACILSSSTFGSLTQTGEKKVVKSEADLPRFNYPISGTVTELLQSEDATFNAFAAKVQADVESVLNGYEIEDHAALRDLLTARLHLQLLAANDRGALETIAKLREVEDKPDAKLLTGLQEESMIAARKATGQSSGPAYQQAYEKNYAAALKTLPWAVVANHIKADKGREEVFSPTLMMGFVKANIEPALAKSHQLSNELAWGAINARIYLKFNFPLKAKTLAVLTDDLNANKVEMPDIWAERDVTLTDADKLTPVNVAIWDSGSDLSLFPGRVYTDAHPGPDSDPHGLAFDLKGFPMHGYLYPLSAEQQKRYPDIRGDLKGYSDIQLSIDSPEATALKKKVAHMEARDVPAFLEQFNFFLIYSHGTHVAGITTRGNPAIRLAVSRLTFDWRNVPLPPTEEVSRRNSEDYQTSVDWFRANHIRVVNISWAGGPKDFEAELEKNGMGKDPADRKAIAEKLFGIEREGLYNAIRSAPDVLFICAAGNADSDSSFNEVMPSSFKLPNLLTVGAVDQAGEEASFTSYGPTVLVDANGYEVESVVPGGAKLRMSGTSMASPNAVNLAAKLIALDPKLTPEQTIHLIVEGATASADGRRHNIDPKRSVELLREMQSGVSTASERPSAAPQPSAEMQSLEKAIVGKWSTTYEFEPGGMSPNAKGTGSGIEVWRTSPGGFVLMEEEDVHAPFGEFFVFAIHWWDKSTNSLRGMLCNNSGPAACNVDSYLNSTLKWDGKQLAIDLQFLERGKRMLWHEVWSDITATSFTQTGDMGESGGTLKRAVTIHGSRQLN